MATQIRLQKQQSTDLKLICELGVDGLKKIATAISEIPECPLKPQDLEEAVRGVVPDDPTAFAVVRQFLSLSGLRRRLKLTPDEVIDGLEFGIRNDVPWPPDKYGQWTGIKQAFAAVLGERNLTLASKATELAYDYVNLLQSAKIVSDIRPVFDESASSIKGAVITFTLRLYYDSADGRHSTSIAMDQQDVENLLEECQRAMVKAATAQSVMATLPESVRTVISGDIKHDRTTS